jgi:hypothetical protein
VIALLPHLLPDHAFRALAVRESVEAVTEGNLNVSHAIQLYRLQVSVKRQIDECLGQDCATRVTDPLLVP